MAIFRLKFVKEYKTAMYAAASLFTKKKDRYKNKSPCLCHAQLLTEL